MCLLLGSSTMTTSDNITWINWEATLLLPCDRRLKRHCFIYNLWIACRFASLSTWRDVVHCSFQTIIGFKRPLSRSHLFVNRYISTNLNWYKDNILTILTIILVNYWSLELMKSKVMIMFEQNIWFLDCPDSV